MNFISTQMRAFTGKYPRQFWLLFWGMLISTIGSSMIWPFLMIYVSGRLNLPLTNIALLLTANSIASVVISTAAGPVIDRVGRKWVMVISMILSGLVYLLYNWAGTLVAFLMLQIMAGAFNPLYRVGADAMMADLIEPQQRAEAYSLMRLSNNLGVAIGPAVGGFIASISYGVAFTLAALGLFIYGLLVAFFAHETLPQRTAGTAAPAEGVLALGPLFRDRPFVIFNLIFMVSQIATVLVWVLMPVYAKAQYSVPESQYGFIPTTNALLVVALQLYVTRRAQRHSPLKVLAVGSLIYALSAGSVALARGFWGFWLCMVVMTFGELMLMPTSTTYVANVAPAHMRGRYMSLYGLTWPVASGIGPVVGALLSDNLGPQFTWYGGFVTGIAAVIGFLVLSRVLGERSDPATSELPSES